jgi:predicted enzyme related to lactoylglutathione lyase
MNLVSIRIITQDVKRLVRFYEQTVATTAKWLTEEFAEVALPTCTIAIGSERTMALFGAGAARGADNHSVLLEFRVDDVDSDYERLAGVLHDVVQKPVTQPWGNRSLLFRDPDGNLVNFFTPVSVEARARYGL